MKPTFIGLLFHKIEILRGKIRILLYKMRGLQIQKESTLGKISCDWPNSLIIGSNCMIQDFVDFRIWHPYDKESYIKVGDRVFIGHGCEFVCNSMIIIGNDCQIASNTTFVDTGHEIDLDKKINQQPISIAPIIIEEDVWIGTGCRVLKGITIGHGSVVGAGSIVNNSIPPNQIWAGTPARFIRNRTNNK